MTGKKPPSGLIVPREVLMRFESLSEALADLSKKQDIGNQRIEILEKHAAQMQSIPATVSGLNSKVESLEKSIVREVDGLRAQQLAHKEEMGKKVDAGFNAVGESFTTVGESITALSTKVGGILDKEKATATVKNFLIRLGAYIGAFLAAAAAIAEIIRALKG